MLQAYYMYLHGFKCHKQFPASSKLCMCEATLAALWDAVV